MFKKVMIILLMVCFYSGVLAKSDYESNIFVVGEAQQTFLYHDHMVSFLKEKKARTFQVYNLLDEDAKRKVYVAHLKESQQDLTQIILKVYKNVKN